MLAARDVHVAFGDRPVLKAIDLDVPRHELTGIVGPNGCGKTTLLRTFYGTQAPDSGTVEVDGKDISHWTRKELAQKLAVVVQETVSEIPVTVAELVLLGRLPHQRFSSTPSEEDQEIVEGVLRHVGLIEKASHNFAQLSGGERQRTLIARAMAQDAEFMVLDEPTNHLDIRFQHEVLALVANNETGGLVVLHDLNLAARYCDRIVVMNAGKVVADGTPQEVLIPEIIEPVYDISMSRFEDAEGVHLTFRLPD